MMRDDPWWRWRVVEPNAEYVRTSKRGRLGRSPLRRREAPAVGVLALVRIQRRRWS